MNQHLKEPGKKSQVKSICAGYANSQKLNRPHSPPVEGCRRRGGENAEADRHPCVVQHKVFQSTLVFSVSSVKKREAGSRRQEAGSGKLEVGNRYRSENKTSTLVSSSVSFWLKSRKPKAKSHPCVLRVPSVSLWLKSGNRKAGSRKQEREPKPNIQPCVVPSVSLWLKSWKPEAGS